MLLFLLMLFSVACQRTVLDRSATDSGGTDEFAEMDFWDELAETRAVSNHDATHALLLSFGGDAAQDYAARVAEAKKRGWISDSAELPPNETARVGWIARAICMEAGISGGITMRVLGPRPRYAVRELNFRGWLPNMSPNQALSGLHLIALLSAVEDEQEDKPDKPREDLG